MLWMFAVWLMTAPPAKQGAGEEHAAKTRAPEKRAPEKRAEKNIVNESGVASFYARSFEGQTTASGDVYRADVASCAHRSHPFGTRLRVTLVKNGRSAICVVNDRGPFQKNRVLDVSRSVAVELGLVRRGVGFVRIAVLPSL